MALDFAKVDKKVISYKGYCEKGKWLEYSDDIDSFLYEVKSIFPEKASLLYQIDNVKDTVFEDESVSELRDIAEIMRCEIDMVTLNWTVFSRLSNLVSFYRL